MHTSRTTSWSLRKSCALTSKHTWHAAHEVKPWVAALAGCAQAVPACAVINLPALPGASGSIRRAFSHAVCVVTPHCVVHTHLAEPKTGHPVSRLL